MAFLRQVRIELPRGTRLSGDVLRVRHDHLSLVLLVHLPALAAYALLTGRPWREVVVEVGLPACFLWGARIIGRPRLAAVALACGLFVCSGLLVVFAGGASEAYFHPLVMLAVVALYQDFLPFAVYFGLAVTANVGIALLGFPWLIGDGGAPRDPWLAAGLRCGALALAAFAQFLYWRATEVAQEESEGLASELASSEDQLSQRDAVSRLFVQLARRNQALLDHQIAQLGGLEHDETDPDALEALFKLDHLATRMRRNAESLLVLAGEDSPRRWGRPVPLADVARAAIAEVEDYTRVIVSVEDGLALSGRAVADVSHLLAELVENALTFSPPGYRVQVRSIVTRGPEGACLLTVEDHGLGMGEESLRAANELLANPPEVGLRLSPQLGFHVVGRLAARHDIAVALAPTTGGGLTALVRLPAALFPVEDPQCAPATDASAESASAVGPPTVADLPSIAGPVSPRRHLSPAQVEGSVPGPPVPASPLPTHPPAGRSSPLPRRRPGEAFAATAGPLAVIAAPAGSYTRARDAQGMKDALRRFQSSQAAARRQPVGADTGGEQR